MDDPDIMIQISLVDVLILDDLNETPWIPSSGVKSSLDGNVTLHKFGQAMEKRTFSYNYDHAVAVMK